MCQQSLDEPLPQQWEFYAEKEVCQPKRLDNSQEAGQIPQGHCWLKVKTANKQQPWTNWIHDTNWAKDRADHKFTSRPLFLCGGGEISWPAGNMLLRYCPPPRQIIFQLVKPNCKHIDSYAWAVQDQVLIRMQKQDWYADQTTVLRGIQMLQQKMSAKSGFWMWWEGECEDCIYKLILTTVENEEI